MTAAALMLEPYNDFFKVGVSSSGNHDNNVYGYYWAERYHGLREVEVEEKEQDDSRTRSRQQGESEARDDGDDEKDKQDDKKEDDGKDDEKGDGEKDGKDDEEQKTQTRFQIQVPSNAELAANLKGHLLLVHGDMDNNVHPAGTLRLVDALIRENKRFDMLIFPGKRHGYGDASSYFTQRKWDYFVEHLMGHSPRSADINNKD
jgi:dipeptidyl aminopeptidase/acylaminoacyl peptidase